MTTSRRIAFGAAAQWVNRGISIVLGLVMMPILLRHLPKEEVGIWLTLGQSWAVLGVLDLGFGVIMTRKIAMAKGKSGSSPDTPLNSASIEEIADLIVTGKRIYIGMAFLVFLVSWSMGLLYLKNLEVHQIHLSTILTAWTIVCVCQGTAVLGSIWTCLLQGMGYVGWDALLGSLISTFTLVAQIAVVIAGFGLVALASVAAIGALTQCLVIRHFNSRRNPELNSHIGKWNPTVLKGVPSLAFRAWLSTLGTVLVFNTDPLIITSAARADDVPALRAAFLLMLNAHILAGVFAQSSSVFISQMWQAGDFDQVRRVFQRNLVLGLCFMICSGGAIIASGEALFNVWLGEGNYVGPMVMITFVVLFILEQHSFVIATSSRATHYEPYAWCMMIGGLLKLALAIPFLRWFGILGLALSTLIAQTIAVYWFVTHRGLTRLGVRRKEYLKNIVIPCLIVAALACALCATTNLLVTSYSDLVKLFSSIASASVILAFAIWMFVLEQAQRHRILTRIGLFRGRASNTTSP